MEKGRRRGERVETRGEGREKGGLAEESQGPGSAELKGLLEGGDEGEESRDEEERVDETLATQRSGRRGEHRHGHTLGVGGKRIPWAKERVAGEKTLAPEGDGTARAK